MSHSAPELSPSVLRVLSRPRPAWRGRMHRWAFVASIPLGLATVAEASGPRAHVAAAVFAAGITFMFGVSALVHAQPWTAARYHRLFQLDHTAIFVCVATGATTLGLLALHGTPRVLLLVGTWIGATVGMVAEWLPFHPPRGLMNAVFLVLGWFPVVLMPWIWRGLGPGSFALLLAGGAFYTSGAIIVGAQRPDPDPLVFGYHEVWHAFVIAAVACHYWMVVRLV